MEKIVFYLREGEFEFFIIYGLLGSGKIFIMVEVVRKVLIFYYDNIDKFKKEFE